jgi:hypothetical protein
VALAQHVADHLRRRLDEAHVRLAVAAERRRHAEDDRVRLGQVRRVRGRQELRRLGEFAHEVLTEVLQVRLTPLQHVDLLLVDVVADDREAGAEERAQQRQADVAESDDADVRRARADSRFELSAGVVSTMAMG